MMSEEQNRFARVFSTASFLSMVVLLAVIPVFFVPSTAVPFQYAKIVPIFLLTLISLAFVYATAVKRGGIVIPRSYVLGAFLAVPVVSTAAALLHEGRWISFVGHAFEPSTVITLFFGVLVAVLAAVEFYSLRRILIACYVFLGSAFLMGIFHVLRLVFGSSFLSFGVMQDVGANTIGTWNELGMFFGVALILATIFIETKAGAARMWVRVCLWAVFVLSLVMVAMVNFSLVWYVVGLLSLGICLYLIPRISYQALLVCVVAVLCVLPITAQPIKNTLARVSTVQFIDVRPSWSGTLYVAKGTLADNALLGGGPNRFPTQWELFRPDINATDFWNTMFVSGVGFIPTALVETGIIGFLVWVACLILLFGMILRMLSRGVHNPSQAPFLLAVAAATVFLWIMQIFYTPNIPLFFLTLFFTGMSVAAAQTSGTVSYRWFQFKDRPRTGLVVVVAIILLILTAGVSTYMSFARGRAFAFFQTGVQQIGASRNVADGEAAINKAIAIDAQDTFLRTKSDINIAQFNAIAGSVTSADQVTEEIRTRSLGALQGAADAARAAQAMDPRNFLNWISVARVYGVMSSAGVPDAREATRSFYNEAIARSPRNPSIYFGLAEFEFSQKELAKAREAITKALQLKGNYAEAVFLLAQIDVADGNISQAVKNVEQLTAITPNDPSIFFRLGLLKYDQKDYKGAAAALERAILLAQDYANAKYFLGLSYYYLGKNTQAITLFAQLKSTNPDNAEVDMILKNLQAGRAPFASADPEDAKPEKRTKAPVKES